MRRPLILLVTLLAVALGLAGPAAAVEPTNPAAAPAPLTATQAAAGRPTSSVDRRTELRKRVQRLRRQTNRATAAPRSRARSVDLKRLRPKLLAATNELARFDSARIASTVSARGVELVAGYEGFVARPAPDPVGFCTAGYGHLIRRGPCTAADVRRFTLTRAGALELLRADLGEAVRAVNRLTTVPRTQGQEDALVSFVFNLGAGAYGGSTLRAKLNRGDYCGAGAEFSRWTRAGGRELAGLVRRRGDERALFLKGAPCAKPANVATPDVARLKVLPRTAPSSSSRKSDNRCVYSPPLSRGDRGRDVKVLQGALRRRGLTLKETGVYDVATKKAVRTIQRRARLRQDGVVGPVTLRKVRLSKCPPRLPSTASLRTTVAVNGTPTYAGLALVLQAARDRGWTGTLTSSDRRRGVAERFGRRSQWQLWTCWVNRVPGCNPANPVGRSTHEQRSDGIAYAGPPGRLLDWWQLGMDVTDTPGLVRRARARGFDLRLTYPGSVGERQHVNLYENPTRRLQALRLVAR